MNVFPLRALRDNYIWIIRSPDSLFFDCVDPGEAKPVIDFATESALELRSILLTHHHSDHIAGVTDLVRHFPKAFVYAPETQRIAHVTHEIKEQNKVCISPYELQVLEIPGHTSTHIAYYEAAEHRLFCGDTLFSAGCGRVFDGTIKQLYDSLMRIQQLPDETLIYCAHEYTKNNLRFALTVEPENQTVKTQLSELIKNPVPCTLPSLLSVERLINPFFRTTIPAVIQYAQVHGAINDSTFEVFKTLRIMKNHFN